MRNFILLILYYIVSFMIGLISGYTILRLIGGI